MRRHGVLMLVVWLAVVRFVIGCALSPPVAAPPSPSQATDQGGRKPTYTHRSGRHPPTHKLPIMHNPSLYHTHLTQT